MSSIEVLIDRQLKRWESEKKARLESEKEGKKPDIKPIVTVSRQRGSQGSYLAEKMAERLGYQLLHRELIDEICSSSGYRRQIIESLDDKIRSTLELWFEGVFKGMYIDASDYFKHLYRVIMSISALGGVIVVGRGSNFVIRPDQGFHIRVIASVPSRIENLINFSDFTREQAEEEIRTIDKARIEFIRNNFRQDIDNPKAYDLVINTSYINIDDAVQIAETAMRSKMKVLTNR